MLFSTLNAKFFQEHGLDYFNMFHLFITLWGLIYEFLLYFLMKPTQS